MLPIALAALLLQASTPLEMRTVTLVASDDKGAPVRGLTASDVVVLENGVAREVVELTLDDRPLTLAVLVDNSGPMATPFRLVVADAVARFLSRLPEKTRFAVWTTGDRPTKVADFGSEPAQAAKALKSAFPTGGNTLLDALVDASQDLSKREGERSAVLVVTGSGLGFANWDRFQVVDKAKASRALFEAVQFDEGELSEPQGRGVDQVGAWDYEFVLDRLTTATGGRYQHALSANGVGKALEAVSAELAAQYRLSYRSLPGGKERKLKVEVTRPEVKVRAGAVNP